MGAAMARELVAAGIEVTIWNRNQATARQLEQSISSERLIVADSLHDAICKADLAICTFTDGRVMDEILTSDPELFVGVNSNLIVADMGTSGVISAKSVALKLRSQSIRFIDCPVSGSVATIAAHQLLVMASGEEADVDAARPIFDVFAKKVLFLGAAGAGQAMKLAVNLVVHTLNAALSEGLALANSGGISLDAAYNVFEESVIAAPFVKYKRAAFLDPAAPVAMRIDTVGKDMRLILELGQIQSVPLSAGQAVARLYAQAQAAGFESQDMASLSRFLQKS
jgi:3-hydroxyisobutyrate dehydrogenase-like beta-hydroxyacid dehydrogenase